MPRRSTPARPARGRAGVTRIRPARPGDANALAALEERCFAVDRLTRRQFRHFLERANARAFVAEAPEGLLGYVLVLLRQGASMARLYSLAIDPAARGRGLGSALLERAEAAALEAGKAVLRLEVRPDNATAIRLYEEAGYRAFGRYLDFYADRSPALRFEKRLTGDDTRASRLVPFYGQTTDFTCGPAALLMAMAALDPAIRPSRRLELRIWRESTTIFMTAGHGGCGPFGLALAAHARGFDVRIFVSDDQPLFLRSVRSPAKKEVMRLVQEDFRAEVEDTDIAVTRRGLRPADLDRALARGGVPLVLVSTYRLYREKTPHWLVILGADEQFVYAHDPWVSAGDFASRADQANLPLPRADFDRMARYGRQQLQAALILSRGEPA